jgi:hypothetical protein
MTALALLTSAAAAVVAPLHLTGAVPADDLPQAAKFDNRPTWDNRVPKFDNRPTWDNWNNKR